VKHGSGRVCEGGPLSLHLTELVVCVWGRKLSGIAQRGDHGRACNIEEAQITIELESGSEGTIRLQARVQVHDVGENRKQSGNN
jgi:hypothetical protein